MYLQNTFDSDILMLSCFVTWSAVATGTKRFPEFLSVYAFRLASLARLVLGILRVWWRMRLAPTGQPDIPWSAMVVVLVHRVIESRMTRVWPAFRETDSFIL